jgi:hypothetical protein
MAKTYHYQPAGEVTFTTTGNIDNLDFSKCALIRMNNASDATIRGLVAGYDGQRVAIVSVGAGNVLLAHQNSNSTAANRLVNIATSASTPLAAGKGVANYIYDVSSSRWRLVGHDQGAFITPAFSAGNFAAGGSGTWTVDSADVIDFSYILVGRLMTVVFDVRNTDVGGTPNNTLTIALPGSFTATRITLGIIDYRDAGASQEIGLALHNASTAIIELTKNDNSAWTVTSSDNTRVQGGLTVEVD